MSLGQKNGQLPVVDGTRPFLACVPEFDATEPAPLPAGWVLEGDPAPRMRILTCSKDAELMSGIWQCGAGRFNFTYDFDETVHLISGGVRVTVSGVTEELRPGSVAFFPRGLTALWEVDDHVKKYFVQRNPGRMERLTKRFLPTVFRAASVFFP